MPNELVEIAKLAWSDSKEGAAEVYETGKTRGNLPSRYFLEVHAEQGDRVHWECDQRGVAHDEGGIHERHERHDE